MTHVLPERPNLSHLKEQAKDLLAAHQSGDSTTVDRTRPYFDSTIDFGLSEAQLVLAREYGFESWAKLKHHVELRVGDLSHEEEADRLATAAMGSDLESVRARLTESPDLGKRTLSAACATGETKVVQQLLQANPRLTHDKTGEKGWEPLLYTCYSCLLKDETYRPRLIATAKVLLDAGADPNAHWLNPEWDNTPEPCLYGATGVNNCPELAELLLKAGANPNDNESLYHSTELPEPTCLKLLLDNGGDVAHGNALARLLDREEPDWVRMMLSYAKDPVQIPPMIPHALRRGRSAETFGVLIASGMALNTRDHNHLTPYQSATRLGRSDVAELLVAAGADMTLSGADEILGRLARGESVPEEEISPDVIRLLDSEPAPELVRQAENGNDTVLEPLLAAGANPNVRDSHTTPLHQACLNGHFRSVQILLQYGADPKVKDTVHDGEAIGWACFGSEHVHGASPDTYVQIVEALLGAGGTLPETAWGSPEVRAALVRRGAKPV
ncbi:MAG: ankyrin repeat domain-containing protein [Akkermansiaceae bacterium]|nr:ankyrin repeat domain-containing protein [Armatimonadota bacterium]